MVISILITFVVSTLFAVIGYFTGGDIFRWFFVSFICQFIFFFILNTITKTVVQMRLNRLEVERLNALDENKVLINCAVCKDPNEVIIKVGQENEFRCERCKSLNSVKVSVSNYQKTEFVDGIITEDVIDKIKATNSDTNV
jgi:phage FluMu protein Com